VSVTVVICYKSALWCCVKAGEELSDVSVLMKDIDDAANAVRLATRKVDTFLVAVLIAVHHDFYLYKLVVFPSLASCLVTGMKETGISGSRNDATQLFWLETLLSLSSVIFRLHHSTTYIDRAYFYTLSSVVCRSVCRSVCWSVTLVSPAKMAEPIEMPCGLWTQVGPESHF